MKGNKRRDEERATERPTIPLRHQSRHDSASIKLSKDRENHKRHRGFNNSQNQHRES